MGLQNEQHSEQGYMLTSTLHLTSLTLKSVIESHTILQMILSTYTYLAFFDRTRLRPLCATDLLSGHVTAKQFDEDVEDGNRTPDPDPDPKSNSPQFRNWLQRSSSITGSQGALKQTTSICLRRNPPGLQSAEQSLHSVHWNWLKDPEKRTPE